MQLNRIITISYFCGGLLTAAGAIVWHWPVWIFFAISILFLCVRVYGAVFIDSNLYIQTICNGSRSGNEIAITFDDGPVPGNTEKILGILKQNGVPAAFFCIGKNILQTPSIAKRIDEEGHLIGNHSFEHGRLFDLQATSSMKLELNKTDAVILKTIKKKPRLFRPPYGITNPNLARAVKEGSFETIGWSIRSLDSVIKDRNRLWRRITKNLRPGDIVLFHDYSDLAIELLPDFINHVSSSGLVIVRLDKLLNIKPYA